MKIIPEFLRTFEEKVVYVCFPRLFDFIVRNRLSPVNRNLALMPLIENKITLDLGCGTAHLPIKLTKLSNKAFIIGVDNSKDLLKVALRRKNVEKLNGQNLYFVRADAHCIPFPDTSFDFIISTGSLHHWNDVSKVLNEIFRVLKRNGQVRIYDQKKCDSFKKIKKAFFDYKFIGLGLSALPDDKIKEYLRNSNFNDYEIMEDDVSIEIRLLKT